MRFLRKWLFSPTKIADAVSGPSSRSDQSSCFCPGAVREFGLQSWSGRSILNAALLDVNVEQCDARNQQRSILGPPAFREYASSAGKGQSVTRDWLKQLWDEEMSKGNLRRTAARRRGTRRRASHASAGSSFYDSFSSFRLPFMRPVLSPGIAAPELQREETVRRPPVTQYFSPGSPEEVRLAPLLSRANLLITRDIEWANIMFAFEQESRYIMVDPYYPQSPVGFISERSNVIYRQLLRTRRPFIAYITDAAGIEVFRVRRPIWLINSSIYAEVDGKEVGVVHRRWHLWRRIYDLYIGNKQFAVVENPGFWNWTFTLKDEDDNVLAQIDRDWRGLGMELFTDAGQYVIRFGGGDVIPRTGHASVVPELEVARQLTLSERAVAVALAISLDNDYFSRRGGWGLPILIAGE